MDKLVLQPHARRKPLAYSDFYDKVFENQVKDVKITGREIAARTIASGKIHDHGAADRRCDR